jgi:serine protease AprX
MSSIKLRVLATYILSLCILQAYGQDQRFFVFLKDKNENSFSIDRPEEFLSVKAINRRLNQNIAINEQDLPVTSSYINEIEQTGAETYYQSRWLNGVITQMDSTELSSVQALAFVDSIAWIGKNAKLTKERDQAEIPSDFVDPPGVYLSSTLQLGMLNVDDMHDADITGSDIDIAVLDGGFVGAHLYSPMQHIFQNGQYLMGEDMVTYGANPFRYSGHGTAVWSIIGARHDSLTGPAYDAGFLLFVTEDVSSESPIEEYNWLIAAEIADSAGVDIIQSSVGYSTFNTPFADYTYQDLDGQTTIITKAANWAFERGMLVITSAGNEGNSAWRYITAPADGKDIIAVGSVGTTSEIYVRSDFSSIGPTSDGRIKPDVMAKGYRTALMAGNGEIKQSSGTSYAAPLITGFAAGLWQANPDWTNVELLNAIRNSGSRALNPDNYYGYGVPNYNIAVLGSVLDLSDIMSERIKVFPNPFSDQKVFLDLTGHDIPEDLMINIFDLKGSLVTSRSVSAHQQGIVEIEIDVSEKGIYLMTLATSRFFKEIKLIKN